MADMCSAVSDRKIETRQLGEGDLQRFAEMMTLFGDAFEDPETYTSARPDEDYVRRLLNNRNFIALAALDGDAIVGALAAYELPKFEQARSEIYIYDLAVSETARRRGIATKLIEHLREIGRQRGAWVLFVQADQGDVPPIRLYSKLGTREDVLHFDIAVDE